MSTSIEWTDATWNPIVGCSRVSPGCENCYAERFVHRGIQEAHRGLTVIRAGAPGWKGDVRFLPERLAQPQRWRRPRRIFVNSLSDLFHGRVTNEQRLAILGAMRLAPQHTYQILTKRPEYALEFEAWLVAESERRRMTFVELALTEYARATGRPQSTVELVRDPWIPRAPVNTSRGPGVAWWIGVTAEDQRRADERIPLLAQLQILPTLRFVSYEPALGPIDWRQDWARALDGTSWGGAPATDRRTLLEMVDWLIVGAESGPGARPFDVAWARAAIVAARDADVPCFTKQVGPGVALHTELGRGGHVRDGDRNTHVLVSGRKGNNPAEWPEDIRVREFPEVRHAA